jgi:hypothetical protein
MTTTPHIVKPETQVNTTDRGTQFQSEITALQDGGYVVVWTDTSLTYNSLGEAIVGQRYDAAGNKVGGDPAHGGEVNLSLFTTGNQSGNSHFIEPTNRRADSNPSGRARTLTLPAFRSFGFEL